MKLLAWHDKGLLVLTRGRGMPSAAAMAPAYPAYSSAIVWQALQLRRPDNTSLVVFEVT